MLPTVVKTAMTTMVMVTNDTLMTLAIVVICDTYDADLMMTNDVDAAADDDNGDEMMMMMIMKMLMLLLHASAADNDDNDDYAADCS
jgi:hypothetical protein